MMGLPQPPDDQYAQDQSGMPQPPPPPQTLMPQGGSGLTLGQANPQGMAPQVGAPMPPQGNKYLAEYAQYLQAAQQVVEPAMRQYLPESTGPGIMANILTMGGAARDHEQYRQGFNLGVDEYNKKLKLHAADLAREMMHDQASGDMSQLKTQMELIGLGYTALRAQRDDALAGTSPPLTPGQMDVQRGMGNEPVPAGGVLAGSGRVKLQKRGDTWQLPGPRAMPGSPADKVGLGASAMAPNDTDPIQGELPEDYAGRRAVERKSAEAGAVEKAKNATALAASIDQLRGELEPMRKAAAKVLPSLGKGGVVAGALKTHVAGPISLMHAQYSSNPQLRDAAKTLTSSARNIFNLIKSEAGGTSGLRITNAEIKQFGQQFNGIASGKATVEDAQTYIDNLSEFLDRRDPRKAGAATTTTTSSATTSTASTPGQLGRTPGGINYRVVQ